MSSLQFALVVLVALLINFLSTSDGANIIKDNFGGASIVNCNDNGPLGPGDTCTIKCNAHRLGHPPKTIYCGNAETCIIECGAEHCLMESVIHANFSTNLEVTVLNKKCLETGTVYLPYKGYANIKAIADELDDDDLMYNAEFYSLETENITIQCIDTIKSSSDGTCQSITVYASDANYLEVIVVDTGIDDGMEDATKIYCPINSAYSPGCIINTTYAESTENMEIYAIKGTPIDVMFYGGGSGDYENTKIFCGNGYTSNSLINGGIFDSGDCFITLQPTLTTANPTNTPTTNSPTTNNPTTNMPTTGNPTTDIPTTFMPTTSIPTTTEPTTNSPTLQTTTIDPTTASPTTGHPTTAEPTTSSPTTIRPTTSDPTTAVPTTFSPSTKEPTDRPTPVSITYLPTTSKPTISPTVSKARNNYTITIETDDVGKLDKDKIEAIIISKLNITAGDVILTTIKDGIVTIQISVSTDSKLDRVIIEDKVEKGIEDEYEDIVVDVSITKTDANTENKQSVQYWDNPLILGLIAFIVLLCISCMFFILYMKSKRNGKGKAVIDENDLELNKTTAMTKVASVSLNSERTANDTATITSVNGMEAVVSNTDAEGNHNAKDMDDNTSDLPDDLEADGEDDGNTDEDMYTTQPKIVETAGGQSGHTPFEEGNRSNNNEDDGLYLKRDGKTPQHANEFNEDEEDDDDDDDDDDMYGEIVTKGNTEK